METLKTENRLNGAVEAVIISGPRKGEFITLPQAEAELTPEEEAALQTLLEGAQSLAKSVCAANVEAEALLAALRALEVENEFPGTPG